VAAGAHVELVVGAVLATRVLGGLDQRPAKARRALLGQVSSPLLVGGVLDDRVKSGGAHDLSARRKRLASPISARIVAARIGPIPKICCNAFRRSSVLAIRRSSQSMRSICSATAHITDSIASTWARAPGCSCNAATHRRPLTVSSDPHEHAHPSWTRIACRRCAQRVIVGQRLAQPRVSHSGVMVRATRDCSGGEQ